MISESDNHSPYLRGLKEKIGQGIDYLATEQNSEKSREKFSSMKEKRRPTMATGLESIEEEFKNLQTKDVINRFATDIESKEG